MFVFIGPAEKLFSPRLLFKGMGQVQVIDSGVSRISRSFILKGERAVIVDTGSSGRAERVLRALEKNDIRREDVSLILITHGHSDHFGNARALQKMLGVPVAAGVPDAMYMAEGRNSPAIPCNLRGRIMRGFGLEKHPEPVKADILVEKDMSLRDYGVDADVLITPGHTRGSLSVLTADGDCLTGDLLMSFVLKNRPGLTVYSEAPGTIAPSLKKILGRGARRLYPTHGNDWGADLVRKKFARMLTAQRSPRS